MGLSDSHLSEGSASGALIYNRVFTAIATQGSSQQRKHHNNSKALTHRTAPGTGASNLGSLTSPAVQITTQ